MEHAFCGIYPRKIQSKAPERLNKVNFGEQADWKNYNRANFLDQVSVILEKFTLKSIA